MEVDPAIPHVVGEVVLGNEFVRDVIKVDMDKFRVVEGCAKVEVSDVESAKFGTWLG